MTLTANFHMTGAELDAFNKVIRMVTEIKNTCKDCDIIVKTTTQEVIEVSELDRTLGILSGLADTDGTGMEWEYCR